MAENETEALIAAMFDAETFRNHGHALIDLLADQLNRHLQGDGQVLNWRDPTTEYQRWQQPLPHNSTLDANALLAKLESDILPASLAIHHPRNLGHQVAPPLPMAALCDLVAALSNQAMAIYETGPSATLLERQVVRWLCELIGWQQADGVLTSGGAQANLTALLAARQVTSAGKNAWKNGIASQPRTRILASEHAHYSIARAAGIMGLGTDAVIGIAADKQGGMRLDALVAAHRVCVESGETVMAVVASAGCTPTGSIDPLEEIGVYCNAEKLWLHVDGAHGASALLSNSHRSQLSGIELADSVVWDGHKLLYMPAMVSAVLFKKTEHSYAAFAQHASYLFQGETPEAETFNTSYRTLECTKRMMGLKLWTAFSLYGVAGLGALVDAVYDKARMFADMLAGHAAFELLMAPQTNIVCFRHKKPHANDESLNRHQIELRQKTVHSGAFHLTQVELHGNIWLRITLMNPFTQQTDLEALLDTLVQLSAAKV